jgi:hypothetical protein
MAGWQSFLVWRVCRCSRLFSAARGLERRCGRFVRINGIVGRFVLSHFGCVTLSKMKFDVAVAVALAVLSAQLHTNVQFLDA